MEMINNVVSFPQVPDAAQLRPQPAIPAEVQAASPANPSQNPHDSDLAEGKDQDQTPPEYALRLTMDKDPDTGDWVYKAINRYTGEVVRQLPRQDLLEMKRNGSYHAGSIIKTEA